MSAKRDRNVFAKFAWIVLFVPVVLVIIPFALAMLLGMAIYGTSLTVIVWFVWCTRGVDTLIVYSESPNWHDYMVESVIPRLRGRSVLLNWSERRRWKWHWLSVAVFHFFGGDRQYNPMVVVLRPLRVPRTFRFWQPFRDCKHGNNSSLHDVENRLYTYLDINEPQTGG